MWGRRDKRRTITVIVASLAIPPVDVFFCHGRIDDGGDLNEGDRMRFRSKVFMLAPTRFKSKVPAREQTHRHSQQCIAY